MPSSHVMIIMCLIMIGLKCYQNENKVHKWISSNCHFKGFSRSLFDNGLNYAIWVSSVAYMYIWILYALYFVFHILFEWITHKFCFRCGILCGRRFNHINNKCRWITLASHRISKGEYSLSEKFRNFVLILEILFPTLSFQSMVQNEIPSIKRQKFFFTISSFHFPFAVHPVINVRNQLVGSPFEKDVTIECNVEASPKSINYWIKDVKDGKCYCVGLSTFVAVCMQWKRERQRVLYVVHRRRTLIYSIWTSQP